jgi:hypothetical protein
VRSRSRVLAARATAASPASLDIQFPPRRDSSELHRRRNAGRRGTAAIRHLLIVGSRSLATVTSCSRASGTRARSAGKRFGRGLQVSRRNGRRPKAGRRRTAAGLAILPGLVRYDEGACGPIRHALRVTVRATNGYVWPASHRAGSSSGALPMVRAAPAQRSKDLSAYPAYIRNIFRGMQTHGLIVADNGSDLYDTARDGLRWNNERLNPAFGNTPRRRFRRWIQPRLVRY